MCDIYVQWRYNAWWIILKVKTVIRIAISSLREWQYKYNAFEIDLLLI